MIFRLAIGVVATVAVAIIVPVQGHADPLTKCLTNTPKGKQVYVPCDLLNAGANFPPGQRCPPPLEQYPKDVADWCGEGPGLASTTPTSPAGPTSPTSPTSPASPTTPTSPTTSARPTTSPTSPTSATSPTSPTTSATSPTSPGSRS
jgi:hypothetical protein